MRRALWMLGVSVLAVGAFAFGLVHSRGSSSAPAGGGGVDSPAPAAVVEEVRAQLVENYYRPVPRRVLRQRSVDGMLAALGDPYTEYLDRSAYGLLRQETSRSYFGIGVTVLPARDGLLVAGAQQGPARAAGIRPGDLIVAIGGARVAPLSFETALGRIVGGKGTTTRLRVRRGHRLLDFVVARRRIAAPSVRSTLLVMSGRRVGYLRLQSFRAGAAQILRQSLTRLERERAGGLVLDLRGNPGGLLDQAVAVTSLFLDRGVVVSVEGAHRRRRVYSATGREHGTRLPLVVLVDRYSASSAEVVAAALQDNHRALLVGERTFGKALVQSVTPLRNGAALKLTTARYLTPGGLDISRRGVHPDVGALDDPSTRSDEALEVALHTLVRSIGSS